MIAALVATRSFLDESLATAGMGLLFFLYAIPVLSLAFVVWAAASHHLSDGPRRAAMVTTILLACGVWTLVRSDGITGDGAADFTWRWAETPEERFLAQAGDEPTTLPLAPAAAETGADWPGFRGPDRDGIISGVRIETDWSASPPVELWRRPIGPGISSFAVRGDLLYTQEQRGDDEVVASYKVTLAGQRVPIRVPRLRRVAGSEIPLRSYAALHGEGAVNDLLLKRVLYGISCRNDAAAAEAIPGAIGLSGSTVSRGFIEASAAKLRELQERDLAGEDVVAMVLDGKTFADATMVIALGITISGEKRFLGFVETDTENAQVLTPFLRSLVERGLDVSQGVLVILDGGKGRRSAVRKAFRNRAWSSGASGISARTW